MVIVGGVLMDEGQQLSKRQLDLEGQVKRLRQQVKQLESQLDRSEAMLAAERAEVEAARRAKAKAERDLMAAIEAGRQEVEAMRQQGEADLIKVKADQAAAEAALQEAAAEGLSGALKSAEARAGALAESVLELQEALDRQRAAADLREEMLRQMKLAAEEQTVRCAKAAAAEAASNASRAQERLSVMESQLEDAQSAAKEATSVTKQLKEDLKQLEVTAKRKLDNEKSAKRALEEELARARQELGQLQGMLGPGVAVVGPGGFRGGFGPGAGLAAPWQQEGGGVWRGDAAAGGAGPSPPALAAPGFKWLLVREGEEPPLVSASPAAGTALEEARLRELAVTRDQLASELVAATHRAEEASDAVRELPKLQAAYRLLEARYAAAVELVGERDEQMEELVNDLDDVKQLYRQQIETLLAQQLQAALADP
eukprot:gene12641-12770_t